ncbi:hypothetical protein G6F60_015608 [Rhizopus arrhizus]|nr:hypothetical protein G6F60_015608 [Rhizopus arrhizus]
MEEVMTGVKGESTAYMLTYQCPAGLNVIGVDVPGLGGGHLETGLALGIGAQERSATVPTLDRCVSTMTDVHA